MRPADPCVHIGLAIDHQHQLRQGVERTRLLNECDAHPPPDRMPKGAFSRLTDRCLRVWVQLRVAIADSWRRFAIVVSHR